jgi:hypothetical protein
MKRFVILLATLLVLLAACSISENPLRGSDPAATPEPTVVAKRDSAKNHGMNYQLEIRDSDANVSAYSENAKKEFASVYPQLVARWSANPATAPRVVTLQYVKNLENAAAVALWDQHLIQVDFNYARDNSYDPGVVTHELTHIVQAYPISSWLTEAIANYSSQLYGPRREDVHRSAASYIPDSTYLSNPYDTGARFLFWIAQNERADIVDQLNRKMQDGSYTSDSFGQLTGKTLDQLWAAYKAASGNVFTIQNKTPQQIYQSVRTLTPALKTSITAADTASWAVTQDDAGSCGFRDGAYVVSITQKNILLPCAGTKTAGHNFAYQVEMTISQGDSGGLIGRGSDDDALCFRVGADGTFDLGNGPATLLASRSNPAIKQGKQTNTLLMVVEDQAIYVYVNGTYLGTANDTLTGGGFFGLMAVNFGALTSVAYRNVTIWQW